MATAPKFASAPNVGAQLLGTRDTTAFPAPQQTPANVSTIITGVAAGTKVEEIEIVGTNTTAAGVVNLFLYDGTTYHLFDQVLIAAVTASSTAVGFRAVRQYTNLLIKDNTWSLRANHTCGAGTNDSVLKVTAFAGDLT